MTRRDHTVSIASDDRARVPFALIGVLVLVSSVAVVGTLQTRPDPQPDTDPSLAVDRGVSAAQTTLRSAVRGAAKTAAEEPVTKTANTPAGKAIKLNANENGLEDYAFDTHVFERYLKLRIYLRAERSLKTERMQFSDGVTTTLSLPDAHYSKASLKKAIDRVEITAGQADPNDDIGAGSLQATIHDVRVNVTKDGKQIATEKRDITVTTGTTVFELHNRTQRYQKRLRMGFFEGDMASLTGFGRRFAARVYPLAYAKSYLEFFSVNKGPAGSKYFKNIVTNYESEVLANDAAFSVQKEVFGQSDPYAERTMKGAWFCMFAKLGGKVAKARGKTSSRSSLSGKICQATQYLFGDSTGSLDPPTLQGFLDRKLRKTGAGRVVEQQLNKQQKVEIDRYADAAFQETIGGKVEGFVDGKQSDVKHGDELEKIDTNFPNNFDSTIINRAVEDVYSFDVSASTGNARKTAGTWPEQSASPGTHVGESYVYTGGSIDVEHTGVDQSSTARSRRLHHFEITVTRDVKERERFKVTYSCDNGDKDQKEDNTCTKTVTRTSGTNTLTFETTLTIQGTHSEGSNAEHRGIERDYTDKQSGEGPSDYYNFGPADEKALEELLTGVDGSSTERDFESQISVGSVEDAGDLGSEVDSVIKFDETVFRIPPKNPAQLRVWLTAQLQPMRETIKNEVDPVSFKRRQLLSGKGGNFEELKDRVDQAIEKNDLIYGSVGNTPAVGSTYENVPMKVRTELRKEYHQSIDRWLDRVANTRDKAREKANKRISKGIPTKGVNDGLGKSLTFLQKVLNGNTKAPQTKGTLKSDELTSDVTFEVHGSPTYLSTKPVTRGTVPSVRPQAEPATDVENTFHAPLATRNFQILPRPGLPLIPWPGLWYLSTNWRNVRVDGEYARFQVSAAKGDPSTNPSTTYVKEDAPVTLKINGLQRRAGSIEPISFQSLTGILTVTPGQTVMPKSTWGPGDFVKPGKPKYQLAECSAAWNSPGAGPSFSQQTAKTKDCKSGQGGDIQTYLPDDSGGTVKTLAAIADDDDDDLDLCSASSASLALGAGVGTGLAVTADDDTDGECRDGNLEAKFIDMGKGSSVLVRYQSPQNCGCENETLLYDAGSQSTASYENDLEQALKETIHKENDVYEIDHLITSHNDTDHISYVGDLLGNDDFRVENIYFNGLDKDNGAQTEIDDNIHSYTEVEKSPISDGDLSLGRADVDIVHPLDDIPDDVPPNSPKHNRNSIVVKVTYANQGILLTGDIEDQQEREFDAGAVGDIDVLYANHHATAGDYEVLSNDFLDATSPNVVVISQKNSGATPKTKNAPNCAVMQRLGNNEIPTYWTDQHGTVEFEIDRDSYLPKIEPETRASTDAQVLKSRISYGC